MGMRSLYRNAPLAKRLQCEVLWRHSFITACLCRELNLALDGCWEGREFTCGLCHDLGRILVALGSPGHFDAADPMDFNEGPDVLARERQILGIDHCNLGIWFARPTACPAPWSPPSSPPQPGRRQVFSFPRGPGRDRGHVANSLASSRASMAMTSPPMPAGISCPTIRGVKAQEEFAEAAPRIFAKIAAEAKEAVRILWLESCPGMWP